MMIVAGIVFLGVMDGLTLFTRLQIRRTMELQSGSRAVEGYYRVEALVSGADSINGVSGDLILYGRENSAGLLLRDSSLIYTAQTFRDTLMRQVDALRLAGSDEAEADTVEIGLCLNELHFTVKFPIRRRVTQQYVTELEQIERGYEYEE